MAYYEVDLHNLTREEARLIAIEMIIDSHSKCIPYVKFVTERENHINATGERGVLYEEFPSWMLDTEIKHLVKDYDPCDGFYIVYLDFFVRAFKEISLLVLLLLAIIIILYLLVIIDSELSLMSDYLMDLKIAYLKIHNTY
ncbi:hypothetical protein RhiirA5_401118 [Rhizophagus irregularis]|uniref:Smr domain-containing protein n=1 Tax=Rhizophagus irregularis TaxID=588596 RepID=A0A2N0RSH1_9GLOM|nr:hypothetical protein RhiirA5_401118 [Rhizophagus irregularis]PKC66250.1 hypothetical protein RhiirA1_512642 [Rhizophagus irregularis]CAB4474511.1 unnamed protein product [Rhizophagus irregularis]CAB5201843.1 unnamed protein product [Rhizophagus irregularis]CAB5304640.1 unnamed protein product [Rhizophagus irregularis]